MPLRNASLFVALMLSCFAAWPAPIERSSMGAQTQMLVSKGTVVMCGFRVLSTVPTAAGAFEAIDTSMNVTVEGVGVLKAGMVRGSLTTNGALGPTTVRPITSFWFKAPDTDPTSPTQAGFLKAGTPSGFLMHPTAVDAVLPLLRAVQDGSPLLIGVRLAGEQHDRIHSGAAQVNQDDGAQFGRCVDDLIRTMKK